MAKRANVVVGELVCCVLCLAVVSAASTAAMMTVVDSQHSWWWKLGAVPMIAVGSFGVSVLERSRVFGGSGLPVR